MTLYLTGDDSLLGQQLGQVLLLGGLLDSLGLDPQLGWQRISSIDLQIFLELFLQR